jgi:hypothetical protein
MKIILSEAQIKSLKESLLLETSDDVLTYDTKYKQILWNISNGQINEYDYIQMPVGTKFKISKNASTISAWNGLINFECNTRNFYDTKKSKTYINKALSGALSDKFCYKGKIKNSVEGAYWAKGNPGIGFQDTECVKKITPIYKRAVYWWKQRFSDPSFINKLKTVNKYTDQQVKAWIVKYKNYLDNNISGPFCPKDDTYISSLNAIAYAQRYMSGYHEIVYNKNYIDDSISDIEATFVHELQHALYDVKPMTPAESWKKVFPYKFWVGDDSGEGRVSTINPSETNNIVTKYGIDKTTLNDWSLRLRYRKEQDYVCRDTELASRVVAMKNLLKYGSKDNITVNDFKKFIKEDGTPYDDENAHFIVLCWVDNGMPDITTFVNNLNKYVVAKVEPEKDDDMKDQTT